MENTEVIILAAGKGTRMGSELPKCLLPVKGIPMIERLLSNISATLAHKPIVVVGYKSEEVQKALGERVRYIHQLEQKGTAHAAAAALDGLLPTTKRAVVLYGDHPFVTKETLIKLVTNLSNRSLSIAVSDGGDFTGWKSILNHYGRIIYEKDGKIIDVVELRDATEEIKKISYVNDGYYAFDVVWLRQALAKVKPLNSQGEYYLTDVVRIAREEGIEVGSVIVDAFEALGLNSRADVAQAESQM